MQMTGNTILITGGGSGIGRALAEQFHRLGNQVIIAGRRAAVLDKVTAANPGMTAFTVDMTDAQSIRRFAETVVAAHPALNVVLHSAGIMQAEDLTEGADLKVAEDTILTNVLGPMRLTAALMPHLLSAENAAILTVSSGLSWVPKSVNASYCASKAAVHSWTISLRQQLKDTGIDVIELVPPYVRTGLTGDFQANDPNAMPLEDYVSETMALLTAGNLHQGEVLVGRVHRQRFAYEQGHADAVFGFLNP
jgi:uncharacterized oxidoreductase